MGIGIWMPQWNLWIHLFHRLDLRIDWFDSISTSLLEAMLSQGTGIYASSACLSTSYLFPIKGTGEWMTQLVPLHLKTLIPHLKINKLNYPSPCWRRREVGSTTRFASSSSGSALVTFSKAMFIRLPELSPRIRQKGYIIFLSKRIKSRPSISVWELELIVCSLALFNE